MTRRLRLATAVVLITALGLPFAIAGAPAAGAVSGSDVIRTVAGTDTPDGVLSTVASRMSGLAASGTHLFLASTGFGYAGDPWLADIDLQTGTATSVPLGFDADAVATDGTDVYLVDRSGDRVYRWTPGGGPPAPFAGTGFSGFTGDGGPASAASLESPSGVAVGPDGSVLIADTGNQRVRRVDPGGTITTVAGDGSATTGGDGGPATSAQVRNPGAIAVSSAGTVYVADNGTRVRGFTVGGTIATVAGTSGYGFSGDGGPATLALLNMVTGLAVDGADLLVSDSLNGRLRRISGGIITTVAGGGAATPGTGGQATAAALDVLGAVTVGPAGLRFVIDNQAKVRTIDSAGRLGLVAGLPVRPTCCASLPGQAATSTPIDSIRDVVVDGAGNVVLSGGLRIAPDGTSSFLAGVGTSPQLAPDGSIVSIIDDAIIRRSAAGALTLVAGRGSNPGNGVPALDADLSGATAVAFDPAGNLYVSFNGAYVIRRIDLGGTITTIAGTGAWAVSGDGGPASGAAIGQVWALATDPAGNLFLAGGVQGNYRVRRIDTGGTITTITGGLAMPMGLAYGPDAHLYVSEYQGHTVRRIEGDGSKTAIAGTGNPGFTGDGGPASAAQLNQPHGLAFDPSGALLVADATNHRVRRIGAATLPGAPTAVATGPGASEALVTWSPPTSNGGVPITGYTVTASPGGQQVTVPGGHTGALLTGLTPGAPFTVTVTATTAAGTGPSSAPVGASTSTTTPGPTRDPIAVAGIDQVQLSWRAPASPGGSAITGYTISEWPSGATWPVGPVTSTTLAVPANGRAHAFRVAAVNGSGTGLPSPLSNAVYPITAPGAPAGVLATSTVGIGAPNGGGAVVTCGRAVDDGGSAITSAEVVASPGGIVAHGSCPEIPISGLTYGVSYTFTTRLTNAAGAGPVSAPSNVLTPRRYPAQPQTVAAIGGNASAQVTWSAPVTDGGSPIIGYTVTATPGGQQCFWTSGPLTCTVTGLANGTPVSFQVVAVNNIGPSGPSPASNTVVPEVSSAFHPIVPHRALDSRTPTGGWNGRLVAGSPRTLTVTGAGGVPASARAVILNTTATGADQGSFLTAYPTGTAAPNASNVNFAAGETIANLVTVKVGTAGQITLANAVGSTDVVADIVGYFDDGTGPGGLFTGTTPTRILDSRGPTGGWTGPLGPGEANARTLQVTGAAGVPVSATAVVLNTTVTASDAGSFLQVWPTGAARPNSSNINFARGQTIANLVTVGLGTGGQVSIANAVGHTHVVADVVGYFDESTGARFHPLAGPTRILDDRAGIGKVGPWGPGQTRTVAVAGTNTYPQIPAYATGVIMNTTVTNGTAGSFITVFPNGTPKPNASNVNFGVGQTIPNLVMVGLPANGDLDIFNTAGKVDIIGDVVGYYAPL